MIRRKIPSQRIDRAVIVLVLFGLASGLHAEEINQLRINRATSATKTLSFPSDQITGKLFLEPESGPGFDPVLLTWPYAWEREYFGVAQDTVLVPEARNVQLLIRLGLSAQESATMFEQNPMQHQALVASRVRKDPQDLSGLLQLNPNDLFRLSVDSAMFQRRGVDQRVFEPIHHLTGLRMLSLTGTGVTDKGLEYLRSLHSLRVLVLTESSIGNRGLSVLMDLPSLEYLDLNTGVTDTGLRQVGQHANLRWLRITPEKIWGPGLGHLANLPRLERLCIWGGNISDRHIKYMEGLTQLKSLTLWGCCDRLTDASLVSIGKLKNLEELHFIRTSPGFTPAGLAHLHNLKQLKKVDFGQIWCGLEGIRNGDDVMRHLTALPNLESIKGISFLSAEGMKTLATFRELRCLGIGLRTRGQGYDGPTGLSYLTGLSFLEELSIGCGDTSLSDADLASLEPLSRLRDLSLSAGRSIVGDRGLASIGKLKQLERLYLSCSVTRSALNQLNSLSNLCNLKVSARGKGGVIGEIDELMLDLSGLKKMKELNLSYLSLEDGDLAFLEDLPVLENLMIQPASSLTGTFLRHLSKLSELDRLWISELSGCTGKELANLNGLPKLRELILSGDITNASLASLTDQPNLHSLNIHTNNPIQKLSVDALKQQHPLIEYIRVNELMKMPTQPVSPLKPTGVSGPRTNRRAPTNRRREGSR